PLRAALPSSRGRAAAGPPGPVPRAHPPPGHRTRRVRRPTHVSSPPHTNFTLRFASMSCRRPPRTRGRPAVVVTRSSRRSTRGACRRPAPPPSSRPIGIGSRSNSEPIMQTNLLVTLRGAGPLHARLYAELRAAVLGGRLTPGARLPATRALARDLGVSRMVVVQAYERLVAEGYLEARVGAGTFVPAGLPLPLRDGGGGRAAGRAVPPREPLRLSAWGARVRAAAPGGAREQGVRFDFRYGRPDESGLPLAAWRRAVRRAASRPETA